MNDEDIIIKELLDVAIGTGEIASTDKLNKIDIVPIKKLQETLSEEKNREISIALLSNVLIINEHYNDFVSSSEIEVSNIRNKVMSYSKETFQNNQKVVEQVGGLYDIINAKWLKKYMDLKEILKIMTKKTQNLCPICQAQIDIYHEKDHFLPKSAFPTLAISRNNLFPVCKTCNGGGYKHQSIPSFPTLTPILPENIPASYYFDYHPVRNDYAKSNRLKTELKALGLKEDDKKILCEISPKDNVSPYSPIHVNNLINLYKTKKLFNRDDILDIPKKDYVEIIQYIKNGKVNKDIREVETKLEEEVSRLVTRLQSEVSTERYKKFRVSMIKYIHKCIKSSVALLLFNNQNGQLSNDKTL